MKRGKKYVAAKKKATHGKESYSLEKAVSIVKALSYTKFKSSVTVHVAIKTPKDKDPKSIKGSILLPNPVKVKDQTIYVFTSEDNKKNALDAGAKKAGLDELVKEVKSGKILFDIALATTDIMPKIAILGKELGPKGLMPSPKNGTVVESAKIADTIKEYSTGKATFTCDETGVIHFLVGKVDFDDEKIIENVKASVQKVTDTLGVSVNALLKSVYLSPTMGLSVRVDVASFL